MEMLSLGTNLIFGFKLPPRFKRILLLNWFLFNYLSLSCSMILYLNYYTFYFDHYWTWELKAVILNNFGLQTPMFLLLLYYCCYRDIGWPSLIITHKPQSQIPNNYSTHQVHIKIFGNDFLQVQHLCEWIIKSLTWSGVFSSLNKNYYENK